MTTTNRLPADWTAWRVQWKDWESTNRARLQRTGYRFPPKNFMADGILGVWHINGRNVELSEVTFPDLTQPGYRAETRRYIGVTYGEAGGSQPGRLGTIAGPLCESFEELERELGIR